MPDGSATRRPTISDVATAAGVSVATVSRVLNGGRWVSDDTTRAVTQAISQTGYRMNHHARSLRTQRSNVVAFLLGENVERLFGDPNFSKIVHGVSTALGDAGLSMILLLAETTIEQERAVNLILSGNVDGVLLASWYHDATSLRPLETAGIPVVSSGIPPQGLQGIGSVSTDDFSGARAMVQHLHESGRRRIAYIAGPENRHRVDQRLEGYRAAIGDHLIPSRIAFGDWTRVGGQLATEKLLAEDPAIDAIFAGNDVMARGALEALQQLGRRVPEDVAVAGFDGSDIPETNGMSLTTMEVSFERMCREMVHLLKNQISGGTPATVTLPASLVRGRSSDATS